ncbi:MAG: glycogen debranching N-terminal domain-containing protein [Candidatus Binataceae bacterium]
MDRRTTERGGGRGTNRRAPRSRFARDPQSVLKVGADFYILAASVSVHRPLRILAEGESFAVFEVSGDFSESPLGSCGFFHRDARHLSRIEMRVATQPPCFLNSFLSADNSELSVNLTNSDLHEHGESISLPRGSVQIQSSWTLFDGTLFERIRFRNFAQSHVRLPIKFLFGADFADLFELRGVKRKQRGEFFDPVVARDFVRFAYRGRDHQTRTTVVAFGAQPEKIDEKSALFLLGLDPGQTSVLDLRISSASAPALDQVLRRREPMDATAALDARRVEIAARRAAWARITTSSEPLNALLERSVADLTTIVSPGDGGSYIMAGIPWFATLFGRDSIITALSVLPFNSEIAAGTLRTLAGLQGSRVDQSRDEQPGKIIHEMRRGEMAATGEVPFARYYGTVDATPLFLWLLGSYVTVTADLQLAEQLWPAAERAITWIRERGDRDADGYVEYFRETPLGLANQGWKDSFDAISHADGELAHGPIALAEVQGYVCAGYTAAAKVAARLAHDGVAAQLLEHAHALKESFIRDFWMEAEGTVAMALDGGKRPCQVIASNAGHCLATGLIDGDHAAAAAQRLLANDMFSGWGIRTLGSNERRYNPMSYHNGSVWPHDNAIAAAGLARARSYVGVHRILEGMVQAASHLGTGSLPELFCGMTREPGVEPVPYPVACHPQAWSAASIFLILSSMLGIQVTGSNLLVAVNSPTMPAWLDWIKIENLTAGGESVSLRFERNGDVVEVAVLEKHGCSISVIVKN